MCDLVNKMAVKERYDLKLIIDETHSVGVLGAGGRGIFEHLDIDVSSYFLLN